LRFEHGILAVLDGSKALRKGVTKVFGTKALVQRCTLHYAEQRIMPSWRPEALRVKGFLRLKSA
jgi:hypothetical protein